MDLPPDEFVKEIVEDRLNGNLLFVVVIVVIIIVVVVVLNIFLVDRLSASAKFLRAVAGHKSTTPKPVRKFSRP